MPARYDSPTQTGNFDDCDDDEWGDYYSEPDEPDNSRGQWDDSNVYSRGSSTLSFSVIDAEVRSDSPFPAGNANGFSPLTPSRGLETPLQASQPLPAIYEWYGQPLYDILTLPPQSVDAVPLQSVVAVPPQSVVAVPPQSVVAVPPQSVVAVPPQSVVAVSPQSVVAVPPQSVVAVSPQSVVAVSPQSVVAVPPQSVVAVSHSQSDSDDRSSEVNQSSMQLSQFFDEEAARMFNVLLHQPRQRSEEEQADETETRFILHDDDIDLSAIRDRSVMDVRFVHEMPAQEPEEMPVLEPEVPLASAPQPGYTAPEEFEPPYNHPLYHPPMNDGQMSHAVEALPYLCAALQIDEDQLKWTLLHRPVECFNHVIGMTVYCDATRRLSSICHMTALTPESHVSITGTKYADYLRNQCNYTVKPEHLHHPLVELADRFLAPLDSLVLYYHV